jgi:hypothetical protein
MQLYYLPTFYITAQTKPEPTGNIYMRTTGVISALLSHSLKVQQWSSALTNDKP